MKSIYTLIPDIYEAVRNKDGWFTDDIRDALAVDIAQRLQTKLSEEKGTAGLRLSKMGATCPKALWHSIHTPELAERPEPWAEIKFSYGHILEALVVVLIKASGHSITGEQDAISVDGVYGHRDCVVDGCIVDIKSCNSLSFNKIKAGKELEKDPFISGYLDQLDGYLVGSIDDPLVSIKDRGYILAIDKTLGHLCLYEHKVRENDIRNRIKEYRGIVERSTAPDCRCGVVSEGRSGNMRLDLKASYNSFKHCCFPTLRTFLYANGPVFLTEVKRQPDVPELLRNGKVIMP